MKSIIKIAIVVFVIYYINKNYGGDKTGFDLSKIDEIVNKNIEKNKDNSKVDFYIRPLGNVDESDLIEAAQYVEEFYGYNCVIESGVDFNEAMMIDGTDEIINARTTINELASYGKTIFIVDKELWYYKQRLRGYTNGTTVLIRGEKSFLKETIIHEVGHTLGLGHCDDLTCIMAINNDGYDSGDFCKKCKNSLKLYE